VAKPQTLNQALKDDMNATEEPAAASSATALGNGESDAAI